MKIRLSIILFFVVSGAFSQSPLNEYYFPKYSNDVARIYKYVNKKDSTDFYYWKVKYNETRDELITEGYTKELFKFNYFVEKFNETGTKVTEFIDYQKLPIGLSKSHVGEILEDDVFKWNDDIEYAYKVNINGEYGKSTYFKERKFIGYEKVEINGKEFYCIKFLEDYKNIYHDQNDTIEFYQITYYAHELGMVKCTKYYYNQVFDYNLTDILDEKEFESLEN